MSHPGPAASAARSPRTAPLRAPALLFDMDGTLVDSTALVEATWAGFCRRHGLGLAEVLAYAHGRPTRETVGRFLPDPEAAAAETRRLVALEETQTTGIVEVPGARDLLAALPPGSWAVVTSAGRKLAEVRLAAAGLPVPAVLVSADDVTRGKPDPEGYLRAAAALGVPLTDVLVFEDSPAGVRAGLAGGARTVVIGGLTDFDAVTERHPDFRDFTVVPAEPASPGVALGTALPWGTPVDGGPR
ncbi:HAD-IA family hydrolase [Streptomyces rubiginosohelvolus]|uniref:HAD-IA family hydrolase n=1 Tax=Streptomyces rubiginosohelvolus TaxID=67362 RepID=UPI0036DEF599